MRKKFDDILSNPFIAGTIALTFASCIVNGMNYLFNIILARTLGPATFGDLATMVSYLAVMSVPLSISQTLIIKRISEAGDERESYARALEQWLFQKLRSWWFIPMAALLIVPMFSHITRVSLPASITLVGLIVVALIGTYYDGMIQGIRRFGIFSSLSLLSGSIKLCGALLLYSVWGSYGLLLAFLLFSNLIRIPISRFILARSKMGQKKISIKKNILSIVQNKKVLIPACSLLAFTLVGNVDIMIVKRLFDPVQAGIYSSWSLLAKIILYGAGSGLSVGLVFFSSSDQKKNHWNVLFYTLLLLSTLSICGIGFYALSGKWFVHLLFGSKFASVEQYIPYAGMFGAGYLLVYYINQYCIARGNKGALLLPLFVPFYILGLYFFSKTLASIMITNIVFVSFMLILYVVYLGNSYLYEHKTTQK